MLTPNASCTFYMQADRGRYQRVFCPAVFWQEGDDGKVDIILQVDLPDQYKGPGREHDYVIKGERSGEVIDTETLRALITDRALTVLDLTRCMYGSWPHVEVIAK
jgi:hypothetical protein